MRWIAVLALVLVPLAAWSETVPRDRADIALSFAPVARAAAPAVVNIYASRVVAERMSPFAADPFFSQFFGDFGRVVPRVENSLGSGVIVSPDGYVVSNHHVIEDAAEIRVVLADRREFAGEVVLSDAESDIAVIRLDEAEDLPWLDIGESDELEVGDLVLAIGNPFGVGQTVSSGIVSALARSGPMGEGRYFLQTDAPINPGNSGGALVDMQGRLVGINTAILTRSGGSNGIGFAIPAELVKQYVAQAREGRERFVRPWAGAETQMIDADLAQALGFDRPRGILVARTHPQGVLAEAGIRPGDVVLAVGGERVDSPAELDYRLASAGLGAETTARIIRDGEAHETRLTLFAAPDDPPAREVHLARPRSLNGLVLATVNPAVIEAYNLSLDAAGAVVLRAEGWSRGAALMPGDIITAVNGRRVRDAAEAKSLIEARVPYLRIEVERDRRRYEIRLAR